MTEHHTHFHFHTHSDPEVLRFLGVIGQAQTAILEGMRAIMTDFTQLEAAVAAATSAEQSGTVALQGMAQKIADLTAQLNLSAQDQAKVDEFVAELNAATPGLAAAIPQNTVADPSTGTTSADTPGGTGGDTPTAPAEDTLTGGQDTGTV